jgi:signal transduction histidine kinase/CheY-like chemotaxis protein
MNYRHRVVRHRGIYLAVSTLLVLLAMSVVAWLANRDTENELELRLTGTLGSYAATVEGGTVNSRAMGAAILFGQENQEAKQLAMGKLPPGAPAVLSALDTLRELYLAETVLLVNERGEVVAYSNQDRIQGTGRNASFRPFVQLALQGTPNVYPAVGLISTSRGIFLSAPVRAAMSNASKPIGAVVIKIGADKLDMLLKSWTDGLAVLVSPQGVVFAASRDDWLFRTAGKLSPEGLANIRRSRQFGEIFDRVLPAPLPFTLDMPETGIDGARYVVRSLPLEWDDPAGDWKLTFLARRPPLWAHWTALGFAGLAGLITALALLWYYLQARNAFQLDNLNARLKQNEEVLRESDELLKESQAIAGLGTYTLNISTGRFETSDVLDKLFGISGSYERSVEGWLARVHPVDRAMMSDYFRNEVIGQCKPFNKEYRIIRHDDQAVRYVHGLGKLDLDAQGRPVKMHGTVQDISERKRAEEEIRQSMRKLEEKELAKTRFLAAAGHDLRQPLAAANLFIDALKFAGPSPDQNKIIERLEQAMVTFNGLLDALLDISKLDAGIIKPEYTSINATELINWLEQNFAPLAAEKKIGFKLHFPLKEALVVRSDVGLVKSVLLNLVSNAIKFTSAGGILVSVRRRRNKALFQVWDTGMGIKAEHLEHIFDEFYQIDNPQRDRASGLGLGLAIAKRALTLLDGKITCHSRIGRGSVFEFRLPLASASGESARRFPAEAGQDGAANATFAAGKHFVVVEDDALVAQALINWLEGMGGKAACFHTAEDALRDAHIKHADYYIVDYMLGGALNGIQFLNKLRQQLDKPIHAVLTTGDTSPSFIREAGDSRWPVLHKPVNTSRLISSLSAQAR